MTPRGDAKTTYGLSLLVEDRLGLTTVTGLLSCITLSVGSNNDTSIYPPFPHLPSSNPDHPLPFPSTGLKIQLTVVSSLSLGGKRVLALLVLGNLVGGVLPASLTLAVYNPKVRTMPPTPSIK